MHIAKLPWSLDKCGMGVKDGDGLPLFRHHHDNDRGMILNNMRIASAAPELLAACLNALGVMEQEYGDNPPPCASGTVEALRWAIAKATGK